MPRHKGTLNKNTDNIVEIVFELFKNGISVIDLSHRYNKTEDSIYKILKKHKDYKSFIETKKTKNQVSKLVKEKLDSNEKLSKKIIEDIQLKSLDLSIKGLSEDEKRELLSDYLNEFSFKVIRSANLALDADATVVARIKDMSLTLDNSPESLLSLAKSREVLLKTNDQMIKIAESMNKSAQMSSQNERTSDE